MRFKFLLASTFLSIFCFCPFISAEEKITITTYYPSPYGSYNQLQTDKFGVGDNNSDGSFTSSDVPTTSGDVWIKGNVGIGTTLTTVTPLKKLILKGLGTTTGIGLQVLDSSNTVLLTTLDSGNVGIGTATPTDKLQIDTSIALHSGGNKVIGFGWSPGANQVLMSGYPAEIRWNPSSGLLQLGIDTTSRSTGSTPGIATAMTINSSGSVGIGTTSPDTTTKVDVLNQTAQAQLGRYKYESTTYAGCNGTKATCNSSSTVCTSCCGGSWIPPCFTKNMQVETKTGSKVISELKAGDVVKSFDLEKKEIIYARVKEVHSRVSDHYYLINNKIEATAEHPFYTKKGWVKVKDLKLGILLFDGSGYIPIKDIKLINKKVTVYNLSAEEPKNFFVEGMLVHNKEVAYCSSGSNSSPCSVCAASGTSSCNTTCCAGTQSCGVTTTTSIGVRGVDTAGSSSSWAGYFAGKLETTGNMVVGGNLAVSNSASVTGTLSAGTLSVSNLYVPGTITSGGVMTAGGGLRVPSGSNIGTSSGYGTLCFETYGCYWTNQGGDDDEASCNEGNTANSSTVAVGYADTGDDSVHCCGIRLKPC
jgi:hypothetical protein